jgi:hypothetical protein
VCPYKKIFAAKRKTVDLGSLEMLIWCALFFATTSLGICQASAGTPRPLFSAEQSDGETRYLKILRQIYAEVKELGPYPGEDVIRREFFVGKDDDDTNKNRHIVILIQNIGGQEKMRIQVTDMEPSQVNPQVKYAKTVNNIFCQVTGNRVFIQSSDYKERELARLIPEILRAVQDKKKLLKLSPLNIISRCSIINSGKGEGP